MLSPGTRTLVRGELWAVTCTNGNPQPIIADYNSKVTVLANDGRIWVNEVYPDGPRLRANCLVEDENGRRYFIPGCFLLL